jgi:hypothetical protein
LPAVAITRMTSRSGPRHSSIPRSQRQAYLQRDGELLPDRQFGNGDVQRAAARAQLELLGVTMPEE